jgi:hypothetical protein
MAAEEKMVEIIKEIIDQKLAQRDQTVLCEVVAKNADNSMYDVYVVPDTKTVIHNIPNMTKFDIKVGEYCYVYKINNNFNNSFICYVKK